VLGVVAGVAETAPGDGVPVADGVAEVDAEADEVVGAVVAAVGPVGPVVDFTAAVAAGFVVGLTDVLAVGVLVGVGLALWDAAGAGGAAGEVPGGSAVPPSCHENATVAPAGTSREPTPREEYFQPDVPSDQ
jgi:hypothetical protein